MNDLDKSDSYTSETDRKEVLKSARTNQTKVIKFEGKAENGETVTWFVAYRGKYGWSACRANGEWVDEPTDDEVRYVVDECNHVELVDHSDTPEEVTL